MKLQIETPSSPYMTPRLSSVSNSRSWCRLLIPCLMGLLIGLLPITYQISTQRFRTRTYNLATADVSNAFTFPDEDILLGQNKVRKKTVQKIQSEEIFWSFEEDFQDIFSVPSGQCGWWEKRFQNWKRRHERGRLDGNFKAVQEHSGFGDRIQGLVTAAQQSISLGKTLSIHWQNIDVIFGIQTSLDIKNVSQPPLATISGKHQILYNHQCNEHTYFECSAARHLEDHCPVYNRACVKDVFCQQMKDYKRAEENVESLAPIDLRMKEVIGCPMRLLLRVKQDFLKTKIDYFMDFKIHSGNIADLLRTFRKHFIITIHIRIGDKTLKEGLLEMEKVEPVLNDLSSCIPIVEEDAQTSKPIKWFVTSDDVYVRNYFQSKYPEKSIILQTKPQHIQQLTQDEQKRREEATMLFAEWFLIGQGDELIANDAHIFGVSAFSRSAWLYNLKDEFYLLRKVHNDLHEGATRTIATLDDSQFCVRRQFEYQGSLRKISAQCQNMIEP